VQGYKVTRSMFIENVVLNPKLEDSLFTKPYATAANPS